ncbi:response regulator PleD [compost metagenome]
MRQAERLRSAIETHKFEGMPRDHRVTVSVGVSEFAKSSMKICEDLVRAADEGLYAAKERGKNLVVALQREHEKEKS